ncbi:MAG: outer membrane protein assembly factor BamA [Gammaproteobacteria bacterium]|nr:MAG: outer membrane protein assembly factor BamA [Gammaproteobacteria bacterium]
MKKIVYCLMVLFQLWMPVWAQQAFVVKHIEIEGLQHISAATVESYLPIKRGQTLQPAKTAAILRVLYQTGFFDRITLSKGPDGTLIIHVVERPTIGELKVSGNSVIPTDKLTTVMKSLDVSEGRVYNPAVLERIKQGLLNQYYQLGRYNARVEIDATPMSRNRVAVKVNISEGLVAKIQRISIVGNHVFDEKTLVSQLTISTSGLFTFITQTDRYSEAKLDESLEKLRAYYMDRGYIRFEIVSAQAQVTPDRKSIYVSVVIKEGERYTVKGYDLQGQLIVPREELAKLINIKPGETFSRQKVLDAEKAITDRLGDEGYLFAKISLRPQIDDQTHEVLLVFVINPGKRIYVRHITFSDNNRTNDVVLRREIQQMEAAPASSTKLEESKHRLLLQPFVKEADMSVNPVEDSSDQVDVNYKVKEDNAATATFKIGYSQLYRTILGAGFNLKNFLGTGNTFGVNLSRSKYEQFYGMDYTDPYYTEDGISRTYDFSMSRVDPRGAGVNNGYTMDQYKAGVFYGIPVGQESDVMNRIQVGAAVQDSLIHLIAGNVSNQINQYVTDHGTHFEELDMRVGYSRDSRNKAIFPTRGGIQTLYLDVFAPLSGNSVSYYQTNYHGKWYNPLTDQFIFVTKADLGYGNGFHGIHDYPFFSNYYAGGIDSVRGYEGYSLGPRDSNDKSFGGNMLADASIGLIFPNFVSENLRTTAFIDGGNVYTSLDNKSFGGQSTNSGPLRYSTGIDASILTPFGVIELSLAQPLNRRPHDERETFQFALGGNF